MHFAPGSAGSHGSYANMADISDVLSRLSSMNFGSSGDDTERSDRFWNKTSLEKKFSVEKLWLDAVWKCKEKPNYGMRKLDPILEEHASNNLELTGLLIEGFLCEVEKAMHTKLRRSCSTGLMLPVRLFVPYTILRHIFDIAVGYGGKLTNDNKTMSVTIETFENASKVLAPAKFSGTNFLKKRHLEKIRENGRSIFKCSSRAVVVVGQSTNNNILHSKVQERIFLIGFAPL